MLLLHQTFMHLSTQDLASVTVRGTFLPIEKNVILKLLFCDKIVVKSRLKFQSIIKLNGRSLIKYSTSKSKMFLLLCHAECALTHITVNRQLQSQRAGSTITD